MDIWSEISDNVKHWYCDMKFSTHGDALGWWQSAKWTDRVKVAGNTDGQSKFMDEVIYLITHFGPAAKVDLPERPKGKKIVFKDIKEPKSTPGKKISIKSKKKGKK